MKFISIAVCTVVMIFTTSFQKINLGIFQGHTDVGNIKIPGKVQYNAQTKQYTIGGSGQNMWFGHDDFHFVWKKMKGDFVLKANMQFKGKGVNAHRKIGWMVRHSLEPNTPYADATVHGDGLTSLQFRRNIDADTEEVTADIKAPDVLQFERKGDTFIMYAAKKGEPLHETGRVELKLGAEVYVGLFICSHEEKVYEEAVFTNVSIESRK